jgi:ribosomal protein L37AE/L43A
MGADFDFESAQECTHNLQKCPSGPADGNCADIAYTLGRVEMLLAELQSAGVVLSIVDEGLAFDAPAEAITDDRLARMRADRDGLLALLRWPVVVPRIEPEPMPVIIPEPSAVVCPWCGSDRLADNAQGIVCERCERLAWGLMDASLVRADAVDDGVEWLGPDEVDSCPRCGDLCDVMTARGGWVCSRCEPQRKRITARWLAKRASILHRC